MKVLLYKLGRNYSISFIRYCFLLFLLFTSFCSNLFAQSYTLGGGININLPGSNLATGIGLNIQGEYRFLENYAIRLNSGFALSEFHNNKYFGSDSYELASFESTLLYYPFSGSSQLFGGLGIGYYLPNTRRGGMPHFLPGNYDGDEHIVISNHLDNSLGYNLLAGLKFYANNPLSVSIEFKYTLMQTGWQSELSSVGGSFHGRIIDQIELNRLTGNLSFNFRL